MRAARVFGWWMAFASGAMAQEQCSSVADCAQKSLEAAYQAKLALQVAVPKGAVMAFNLEKCPDGWTPFKPLVGRVVVGAGSEAGSSLSPRKLGELGGEEKHILSVPEMPSHTHSYIFSSGNNSPAKTDYTPEEFGSKDVTAATSATGNDQPHNNMQPFTVLLYCERL